jgi:choline dehydrogenase-like flavoprotein
VLPNQDSLGTNASFQAEAQLLWKTSKTGPLAAYVNSGAFLPLRTLSNRTDQIVEAMLAQDPAAYLPKGLHPTLIAGYAQQVKTLARQYKSQKSALLEMLFSGGSTFSMIHLKVMSRGTVYISPNDDGVSPTGRGNMEPVVDWRTWSNPIDPQMTVEFVKWVRTFMKSKAMVDTFDPVETNPGPNVVEDADIQAWVRGIVRPSNGHMIGTAALAPLELGGVVGPDLKVYGTDHLSIADNSIMTLIPGAHTSSTAYAIGEKVSVLR